MFLHVYIHEMPTKASNEVVTSTAAPQAKKLDFQLYSKYFKSL